MWKQNKITAQLGIQLPIIQAPMAGGVTTPALIAAVSNAGGLGSLGAGYMKSDAIKKAIQTIRHLTPYPFAVNLFIPEIQHATADQIIKMSHRVEAACSELNIRIDEVIPPFLPSFEEQMEVIIEEKVPVFSFTFGTLNSVWMEKLKHNKTYIMGTATHVAEGLALEANGVDAIVAQGSEAGGHRGTFLGSAENALIRLRDLLPQLANKVKIPLIAAGGIMDGKTIHAALTQDAQAVQMGTAFLTCPESGICGGYRNTLMKLKQDKTVLTRVFSGKLARGIRNTFIDRMGLNSEDILDYPIQNAITRLMRVEAQKQNASEFLSLWAGQSAFLSRGVSAPDLMQQLLNEMEAAYKK